MQWQRIVLTIVILFSVFTKSFFRNFKW